MSGENVIERCKMMFVAGGGLDQKLQIVQVEGEDTFGVCLDIREVRHGKNLVVVVKIHSTNTNTNNK